MRPIELRIANRDDQRISLRNRVDIKILRLRSEIRRLLGSTSVNIHLAIVGRQGLDPGTLGLREGWRTVGIVRWRWNGRIQVKLGYTVK